LRIPGIGGISSSGDRTFVWVGYGRGKRGRFGHAANPHGPDDRGIVFAFSILFICPLQPKPLSFFAFTASNRLTASTPSSPLDPWPEKLSHKGDYEVPDCVKDLL